LAGPVQGERRETPIQEQLLGWSELLFGRVEAGDQHDRRVRPLAGRDPQDADHLGALEGDFDSLAGGIKVRERVVETANRTGVGSAELGHVLDEHELRKVVVDSGLGEVLTG
jgi:hypothetical protein